MCMESIRFRYIQIQKDRNPYRNYGPKSDRRGSNPRPRPWQGRTLPTEPLSRFVCVPHLEQYILYYKVL